MKDQPIQNHKPGAKRLGTMKWHRIYYLLAFFDVLIVVFGLFLNHHLISVQRESVQSNEVWVNRLDKYLALRRVANKVSQPGDDVFATQDSIAERRNMEQYLIEYNKEFRIQFDEIGDAPTRFQAQLTKDLNAIDTTVQSMAIQCRVIFDYYDKGDAVTAGAEMAKMDQMLGEVNDNLSVLHSNVIQIQHDLLTEESEYVSSVQRYEFITAAFVLFMVTVAVVYGNKIKKRTEEATSEHEKNLGLEAANNFSTRLFNSIAEMLIVIDENGIIYRVNDSLLAETGFAQSEIIGQPIRFLMKTDAFLSGEESQIIAETGQIADLEKEYVCRDNKIIPVSVSWSRLDDDTEAAVIVAKNITERKRSEEKLKQYSLRLEQSNRELQEFVFVASHDLQELLRKVQAFGDRLKQKYSAALGDDGNDYVKRMSEAARRMQTLITDLLTFSRVSSKVQPFVSVSLGEITREVVSDLEVRIEQTGGRVEVENLPTIDADPTQMRQLLQNLIGNALKFHHPNVPPIVKIAVQTAEINGTSFQISGKQFTTNTEESKCQIIITDNGIGFDEKYLNKIFTVFQRLHGRQEYEGSGVGLAVCRKIVERHGGEITARSRPGEGATFIITLPTKQIRGELNQ